LPSSFANSLSITLLAPALVLVAALGVPLVVVAPVLVAVLVVVAAPVLALVLALVPAAFAAATPCGDNFTVSNAACNSAFVSVPSFDVSSCLNSRLASEGLSARCVVPVSCLLPLDGLRPTDPMLMLPSQMRVRPARAASVRGCVLGRSSAASEGK
jgi:hypothetical protein